MLGIHRPFVHPERDVDGRECSLTLEYGSATVLFCCPKRFNPVSLVRTLMLVALSMV